MLNFKRPWLIHIFALLPLGLLLAAYLTGNLTANPIQTGLQRTGKTALILLLVTLALTPLNKVFDIPQLTRFRRPLGLYSFLYALLHATLYIGVDYQFNWSLILANLAGQPFLVAGAGAFLVLLALAVTSNRWSAVRLLGQWKNLHRLVYLGGILAIVHYTLGLKGDFWSFSGSSTEPQLYVVLMAVLLLLRIPFFRHNLPEETPVNSTGRPAADPQDKITR